MKKKTKSLIIRGAGYLGGVVLLFAPFALIQRALISVFGLVGRPDTHGACYKMFISRLFSATGITVLSTSSIIVFSILAVAVAFGPLFCGRLCVAGALGEFLSRLVPDRFKLNWQKYINPTPIRYGVTAVYLASPFLGLSFTCAFCNFNFMEKLILGTTIWDLGILGSTAILTAFLWIVVFGLFANGGRGFCSYLCPVGAIQSILHAIGSRLGVTGKLKLAQSKCISCKQCTKECPMGAIQIDKKIEKEIKYNIHNCIACTHCVAVCPKSAISYGRGKAWQNIKIIQASPAIEAELSN